MILNVSCGAEYDTDNGLLSETVDLCNYPDNEIVNIVTTDNQGLVTELIEKDDAEYYYFCKEPADDTISLMQFAMCQYYEDGSFAKSVWVDQRDVNSYRDNLDFEKCLSVDHLPE